MIRTNNPTLEDVARAANVSTATISRSINEPHKVAKDTRERIEQVIQELGFTTNFGGKVLATKRSNTVGAIIPTMDNSMFASGLQAFQEALSAAGIITLVSSTGYDSDHELRQIRSLVAHGADGLLLIGAARPAETTDFLALRNIPYVITWSFEADESRVFAGFDNKKAAYEMTKKVLEFGHQRIDMIAGYSTGNDRAGARIQGVKQALSNIGNNPRLPRVIETGYSLEQGSNALEDLMNSPDAPTAIVCGNDVLAVGAILRAQKIGLRVPEDVSVTGFDDISLASAVSPPLTTVRVPQRRMGKMAAKLLMELLSSGVRPPSIEFATEVILRESLAAPKKIRTNPSL
ncbi:MAG: LacI family transcriptional regulator [Granulosicoccus sp.]|jgi:LacI family transcriptional regulator